MHIMVVGMIPYRLFQTICACTRMGLKVVPRLREFSGKLRKKQQQERNSWISLASDATLKPHGVEGAAVHVEVAREPRAARRPRFGRRNQEQHSSDSGENASPPVHDVSLLTLTCFQLWGIQHLSSVINIISSVVGRGKKFN